VRRCGTQVSLGPELTWVFPTPEQVAAADLSELGVPGARARTLIAVAEAARADALCFEAAADLEQTTERLRRVSGIGEWTAHYIALRAAREPDAFPASDRGILRGMALASGADIDAVRLSRHAEGWRPFRGYAAQHLWAADAEARDNSKPTLRSRPTAPRRLNEKEVRP
jgi:AraC family transcriptional regulator, regulatory protein of adaptative response / DNA-3-methyladenine glycosylase II